MEINDVIGNPVHRTPDGLPIRKIKYEELNGRAKEDYNYYCLARRLAELGYFCERLNNDWKGADFIAVHVNGSSYLVQQKSRITVAKKYDDDLFIAFLADDDWYIVRHGTLKDILKNNSSWTENDSSYNNKNKGWSSKKPTKRVLEALQPFRIPAIGEEVA